MSCYTEEEKETLGLGVGDTRWPFWFNAMSMKNRCPVLRFVCLLTFSGSGKLIMVLTSHQNWILGHFCTGSHSYEMPLVICLCHSCEMISHDFLSYFLI